MNRRNEILKCIDICKGVGLELGPLDNPTVSKSEANIKYLDHMSTEGLKKKYKGHAIIPENIVAVDYVLKGNSLKKSLRGKKFDYVIASHVMEHVPDIVSWFADVESILNNNGILSLAIPDRRFTFDVLRDESTPADAIGAYLDKQTRASSVVMYDYLSKFRYKVDVWEAWHNPYADFKNNPKYSEKEIRHNCLENLEPGKYVDSHCFVFTPSSFVEILRNLIKLDLFGYKVEYLKKTRENQLEFYVSLRKVEGATKASKLSSLPKLPGVREKHEIERENIGLKAEVESLKMRSSELEVEMIKIKSEVQDLLNSKSWRITKPVRKTIEITRIIRRKK